MFQICVTFWNMVQPCVWFHLYFIQWQCSHGAIHYSLFFSAGEEAAPERLHLHFSKALVECWELIFSKYFFNFPSSTIDKNSLLIVHLLELAAFKWPFVYLLLNWETLKCPRCGENEESVCLVVAPLSILVDLLPIVNQCCAASGLWATISPWKHVKVFFAHNSTCQTDVSGELRLITDIHVSMQCFTFYFDNRS